MDITHSEPDVDIRSRLEKALNRQYGSLDYFRSDKQVYCWRRYLFRLKGFRTVGLDLLLANIKLFSDHVVVVDPCCSLKKGQAPGQWLIVAPEEFAIKCLFLGLPEIRSMSFKKPRNWNMWDQLGLELKSGELP